MDYDSVVLMAKRFVDELGGSWNHGDWQNFLAKVKEEGCDLSEEDIGAILEEEKRRYWVLEQKRLDEEREREFEKNKTSKSQDILVRIKNLFANNQDLSEKRSEGLAMVEEQDVKRVIMDEKSEENMEVLNSAVSETKKEARFMKTGIGGFDALLSKGIPCGASILLVGGPGCGKTTFGLQLLMEAASRGENCIYMSFEEKEEQLISHLENFGFPPKEFIQKGNLVIKRYDPFMISQSVEALLAEARGELLIKLDKLEHFIPKGFHPEVIVLDSLSAVAAAFAGKKDGYRIYIEQLFRSLEKTGATSFLITETSNTVKNYESKVEEFLADGVISFYNVRRGNTRVKALEIIKIRGVNFKKKIVPFDIIEGGGIEVYPMEEVFTKKM